MNFNGGLDSGSYRNNKNRNRNNKRNNRGGGNRLAEARKAMSGSMLPRWYRNAFFNDCAEDVQSRTRGDIHPLEYASIRLRKEGEEPRKTDAPRRMEKENNKGQRRFESPAPKQEKKEPVNANTVKRQQEKDVLDKFISDYGSHISDISYLTRMMIDTFPEVLRILRHYGDNRYMELNNSMDKVFTLLCTSQLSSLILAILEDNGFDNWDEDWKNLAVVISIVLSNYGNRINNTGAKSCYVNDIIPSGAMWKREIGLLTEEYGITREMAMDLVMKIPVLAENMTLWDLNQYAVGLEWCILMHGKDNMEILDKELQGKLFDFFFKAPENDNTAKAISRLLASPLIPIDEDDEATVAIRNAFGEMIYDKLDALDIDEIERTLKYIIKTRKQYEKEGKSVDLSMYAGVEAVQFENVAKAIQNIVDADNSAKQYLA